MTNRSAWRKRAWAGLAASALSWTALAGPVGPVQAAPGFELQRVAGGDRYETAATIADRHVGGGGRAILVNGEPGSYADALTANYLAGRRSAPILLTQRDTTPKPVLTQLKQDGIETVLVVGGTNVVSAAQVRRLRNAGYTVSRISGRDRFATNAEVIEKAGRGVDGVGLVATGMNFPDALAGGPLSYDGRPLGLSTGTDISDDVVAAMKSAGVTDVVILGGTNAVAPAVARKLDAEFGTVTRLAGGDRAETSTKVADHAIAELGFTDEAVNVASGYLAGYGADALAGGPLTGQQRRPLLVTPSNTVAGEAVLAFLRDNAPALTQGLVFGGPNAISDSVVRAMTAAGGGAAQDAATVTAGGTATAGGTFTLTVTGEHIASVAVTGPCLTKQTFTPADDADAKTAGHQFPVVVRTDAAEGPCKVSVLTSFSASSGLADETDDVDIQIVSAQDFAVTGGGATVPEGSEVTYTASRLPANGAFRVVLADAGKVTIRQDGSAVFAKGTGTSAGTADTGTVQARITEVDGGVVVGPSSSYEGKASAQGTVTFEVTGAANVEEDLVPVVFVDADGDDRLDVDGAGKATERYGVGQVTTFVDVAAVELTPESDLRRFGTQHTVTVQLRGDSGPAPMAGQPVSVKVERGGATVQSGTVTTNATGAATFSYVGPQDPDGNADDPAVSDTITATYVKSGPAGAQDETFTDTGTVDWSDDPGTPDAMEIVTPSADVERPTSTQQTVVVQVRDQYGAPWTPAEGQSRTVTFEVSREGGATTERSATVGADGRAAITVQGPSTPAKDTVTATLVRGSEDTPVSPVVQDPADLVDSVAISWV